MAAVIFGHENCIVFETGRAMVGNRWRSPTDGVATNVCNQSDDVEQKQ